MEDEYETSALRTRRKKSSMSLSCCFNGHHHRFDTFESTSSSPMPSPRRSSSNWIRSKTHDSPETKGKRRNFISRMGRHRRHSADFSYDPLSYSLNFEDDHDSTEAEEFPMKNFAARLPASPPRRMLNMQGHNKNIADLPIPRATTAAEAKKSLEIPTSRKGGVTEENIRGIEISRSSDSWNSSQNPTPPVDITTSRAVAVAEVRKSLEEVKPTVATSSSSRSLLVKNC